MGQLALVEEAVNGVFDRAAGVRQGCGDRVAEALAQLRRARADGQQQSFPRLRVIELAGEGEQLRRAEMMRRQALRRGDWRDQRKCHRSGRGGEGAVEKKDRSGLGYVLGQIRRPLLARHDAHARIIAEALFGPVGEPGADAVVATQGVAAGEDEAANRAWIHECTRDECGGLQPLQTFSLPAPDGNHKVRGASLQESRKNGYRAT